MITLQPQTEALPTVYAWLVRATRREYGQMAIYTHSVWGRTEAEARANHDRRVQDEGLDLEGYTLEFTPIPNY